MEILASEDAVGRIGARLKTIAPSATLTSIGPGGRLSRNDEPIEDGASDPEVFFVSLDLYVAGLLPIVLRRMRDGTKGAFAQLFNAGLDAPIFRTLMEKGLKLAKSSAQAPAIAEYVMAHALARLHPIDAQRALQTAKSWAPAPFREIGATHWVMIGYGSIGVEIAKRLKPFGARLTIVRRQAAKDTLGDQVVTPDELGAVLPDADVVVLACALTDETRGLVDERFLEALKPGALLINIARGAVVNEAALRAGLDVDRPGHAVLDVFDEEPLPTTSWIWSHPKITATAHCSNAGDGVLARGDELFLENLHRYIQGRPLLNLANLSETGAARRPDPAV